MADNNTPMLVVGIIVVVLITAGLTYYIAKSGGPAPFGNQTNLSAPTITVTGEASKTVTPDLLTVGMTVTGNGSTVADSQSDAAAKVAALKAALLAAGVAESDIQTSSFYTTPAYNSSCYCYPGPIPYAGTGYSGTTAPQGSGVSSGGSAPAGEPTVAPSPPPTSTNDAAIYPVPPNYCNPKCQPIGYNTVHSLTVKSTNVTAGGQIVDSALGVNGTRFDYVYFSLQDSTRISLEDELQGEAAAAAKSKAESIAAGVGAKLGKVVSINPNQYYPYPVYAQAGTGYAVPAENASPPTQLFPSDTTLTSSITVVYELVQ